MKERKLSCFALVFFLMTLSLSAQKNISGSITDFETGIPMPGVTVLVKGTNNGRATDFDGSFSILVNPDDTLVFSYIGYASQEILIGNQSALEIQMRVSQNALDEVVVIGYGTQTKKEITGAVGLVSAETIDQIKPVRIEQALQGQVPGVSITSASGSPGSASNIRIRGISTNGNNDPLILVDGNVIVDLSVINPADIASINILKDATAGIYGARAANGVILITTKSGRKNAPLKVAYDNYFGLQTTSNKIKLLNATEYAVIMNESAAVAGNPPLHPNFTAYGVGTNWQNEVFSTAPVQNHNLRADGGTEKLTYSFGASFLDQDGIVGKEKSNFNRFTLNTNLSFDFTEKLNVKATAIYTSSNKNRLVENALGSVLFNAINMNPVLPVMNTQGNYSIAEGLGNEVINPVAQINNADDSSHVEKISATFGGSYEIFKGLSVESKFQYNHSNVAVDVFKPVVFYGSGKVFNVDTNELIDNDDVYEDYTWDNYINYSTSFNEKHNIKVLLGTSAFKTTGIFESYTGSGFSDADIEKGITIDDATQVRDNNEQAKLRGANTFDVRLLSQFGRLQYDFDGKYLLSAMIRRDGSTRFGPNNRFGYFPSVSVGWVVSEESFLNDNSIDFLKLRASYGIMGNDQIGDYRYVSTLGGQAKYAFYDKIVEGLAEGALSNPDIKWEEQISSNFGFDLTFLDSKVNFTFDYFSRKTQDLLLTPQVSGILGAVAPGSSPPTVNAGTVLNRGFEYQVGYNGNLSEDLFFNASLNFTVLENEVLFVASNNGFEQGGAFGVGQAPPVRMQAGYPIGYFYGYKTDGVFQSQAEIDNAPTTSIATAPGDLKFVDLNNDGVIDLDDRTYIGDPHPSVTFGFNLNLNYKNFDFSASAFGVMGSEIVRNYERNQPLVNKHASVLNRWTGSGTTNEFPRVTAGTSPNSLFSDYFIEDGDFLRIQNIQLGYTLPENILGNGFIDNFRVYFTGANLFTFTKYSGFDPTTSNGAPLGGGIDLGFYPMPKIYSIGLNLNF